MKKILLPLLSLSILISTMLNAMAPKELLKKVITSNLTFCSLVYGINHLYQTSKLEKEINGQVLQDPARIAQVQEFLAKSGIKNPETFRFIKGEWATNGPQKVIWAPESLAVTNKQIAKDRFFSAHEAGHIQHHDLTKSHVLSMGLIWSTINVQEYITKHYKGWSRYNRLSLLWGLYALTNTPIQRAYGRQQEKNADMYAADIVQDPAIVQAAANHYAKSALEQYYYKLMIENKPNDSSIFEQLYSTHPSDLKRAYYLSQHAKDLRARSKSD